MFHASWIMSGMGLLYDYFAAASDGEAESVMDQDGGPSASAPHPELVLLDTGIEPIVQLGTLEALLTGRTYDKVIAHPRSQLVVATRDEGQRLVLAVTDTLVAALADASEGDLARVAGPWSKTPEFWGQGDATELADRLNDLSGLARRASEGGLGLYCWLCV